MAMLSALTPCYWENLGRKRRIEHTLNPAHAGKPWLHSP